MSWRLDEPLFTGHGYFISRFSHEYVWKWYNGKVNGQMCDRSWQIRSKWNRGLRNSVSKSNIDALNIFLVEYWRPLAATEVDNAIPPAAIFPTWTGITKNVVLRSARRRAWFVLTHGWINMGCKYYYVIRLIIPRLT